MIKMDPKYIVAGLILIVIIVVILIFALKSDDTKKTVSLDGLTNTLHKINSKLSAVKTCIDNDVTNLFALIDSTDVTAQALIKTPSVWIKPSSITAYTNALTTVQATRQRIKANYPPCSTYCNQAKWDDPSGKCVCSNPYPFGPITSPSNYKYCFATDCTHWANGAYTFSNDTPDPSKNADCGCVSGFEHDGSTPGNCYNIKNSLLLDGYTSTQNTTNTTLMGDFPTTTTCPGGGNCSGNGTCDQQTGTCTCNANWLVPDCSKKFNMIFCLYQKSAGSYYLDNSAQFNIPQTTFNNFASPLTALTNPAGLGITQLSPRFTIVFYASSVAEAGRASFTIALTQYPVTNKFVYFIINVPIKAGGTVEMYTQDITLSNVGIVPNGQLILTVGVNDQFPGQTVLYTGGDTPFYFFSS